MGFWGNMYDNTDIAQNNTINLHKHLNESSFGVTWNYAKITIEVHAITRQRLITAGQSNYLTYDFETSQNLIVGIHDRFTDFSTISSFKDLSILSGRDPYDRLQHDILDHATKIEVPQRYKWTHHIDFPSLNNNFYFMPVDISNSNNYTTLIPGCQNIDSYTDNKSKVYAISKQNNLTTTSVKATGESSCNVTNGQHIQTVSYPSIVIGQPRIPDETGVMKFRYKVRVITEINGTWHLYPEFCNNWEKIILRRQIIALPTSSSSSGGSATPNVAFKV